MAFTTKDFIENLEFDYFETYSFQRNGEFEIYENLGNKYADETIPLTKEEASTFKKLRQSNIYKKENNHIFAKNGALNQSAELISKHTFVSDYGNTLVEVLKVPSEDFLSFMCMPIYRDAILFYNSNSKLLEGINICFGCSSIVTLKNKEIFADIKVYSKLRDFLIKLGHKIR